MAKFFRRPLEALDWIYNFAEGLTHLSSMAVDGEIQPVHDLSREAEVGSGLSQELGYFIDGSIHVHSGSGTIRDTLDPWAQVDLHRPIRAGSGVWMIAGFCHQTSSGDFTEAGISVTYPTIPDAFLAGNQIGTHFFPDALVAVISGDIVAGDDTRVTNLVDMPLYIPDGSTINNVSTAGGAITIDVMNLFWAGAKGVLPPGMS